MKIWVDAQLSPALATWLSATFQLEATAVRDVGLRNAEDEDIFAAARAAAVVVLTKDTDFANLLDRHGPPPHILSVPCGNPSNAFLKKILKQDFPEVLRMLEAGEPLVEISEAW